ncbi:hypothetical protein PHYBOEH_003995 [Phytophthora boehmeriae]|uniref:Uncharacterized protein n=1 Tax=Phytophthora boehmeriae TaxID=109152 RepID=A0A8T1WSK7_9STRA|nr:hypothetical protein PHYBOEH_003995 [Phytophthora boehmeriae]
MAPRARIPSFTSQRVAATYSTSAKMRRTSPIKTQMAIINWENVLVPMDWMVMHLGLGNSADSTQQAVIRCRRSPGLLRDMAAIEERIMLLLTEAMQSIKGPVVITSEYSTVFIEYISSLFFPRLTTALRNATTGIYVVGTPYTMLTEVELSTWKANLMHTAIFEKLFAGTDYSKTQCLLASEKIGIIALCARETDVTATSAAYTIARNAIIKRVKVKAAKAPCAKHPLGSPIPLQDFHAQLQSLTLFVKQAAVSNHPIGINL